MKIISVVNWAAVLICIALSIGVIHAEIVAEPGTHIENLSASLLKAGVWLPPTPDFEVAKGTIWVQTGDNGIVDLASGARVLPRGFLAHSFARTRQGSVVIITENVLGGFTSGFFLPTTKLPYGNMRVTAGPDEKVLIYGGPDNNQLLIIYDGTSFSTLLRLTEPIGVVTHIADRIFLSAGNKLLTVKNGESPGLVFALPDGAAITGIAVDATQGVIYIATAESILALKEGVAMHVIDNLGGRLQWQDGALYVLDPGHGLFAKVTFPKHP